MRRIVGALLIVCVVVALTAPLAGCGYCGPNYKGPRIGCWDK